MRRTMIERTFSTQEPGYGWSGLLSAPSPSYPMAMAKPDQPL